LFKTNQHLICIHDGREAGGAECKVLITLNSVMCTGQVSFVGFWNQFAVGRTCSYGGE